MYIKKILLKIGNKLRKISWDLEYKIYQEKKIKKLKDIHKGQRCFIIGNGPSLKINDLEKLNNEYTFVSNRIYNIFNETNFRPTYYFCQDFHLLRMMFDEDKNIVNNIPAKNRFYPYFISKQTGYKCDKENIYFRQYLDKSYPNPPRFNEDVSKVVIDGFTVTYSMLQFAFYMGFKEIYLIGIDHNYNLERNADGTIKINEGVVDHFTNKYKPYENNIADVCMMELSYLSAKNYLEKNGVKIFNATRGGKLEVFERIDFDSIVSKSK